MDTTADQDVVRKSHEASPQGEEVSNVLTEMPISVEIVSLGKVEANTFGHGKQWEDNGVHSARQ